MIFLRQSTASQEVPLGYFLDSTDGNTEETALTIANTDIKLWKSGATTLANKNSGGATHISNGVYYAVLDATDTNTLGSLVIFVHVSGALTVRLECVVLAANVYDSLIAASDNLQVDLTQILGSAVSTTTAQLGVNVVQVSGDSVAADNLEADYDGTGYNKSASTIGTCTTNTDMRGTDSAFLAASAPTNFSSLVISAGGAVDSLLQGILNTLVTETTAGRLAGNLSTFLSNGDAASTAVLGNITSILGDTNELQTDWADGGRLDLIIDAILNDTNELQTDDVPGLIAALNDPTAAAIASAVLGSTVETQGSYTFQQAMSICLAVLAGVTSASGATISTPNGLATRVAATTNASNERTAMTLTPSA